MDISTKMLFQNANGKLIEIIRSDYVSDSEYYSKILRLKGVSFSSNNGSTEQRILKTFAHNVTTKTRH